MENILSPSNREVLAQIAWSNVLLAFDFDGTLAPIVVDRETATIPAPIRTLLEELSLRYPCAIISGRSRDDVLKRVRGIQVWSVVGNHGLEPSEGAPGAVAEVQRWRRMLVRRLAGAPGISVEDKVYSLAIHYRRCRKKREVVKMIREAIRPLKDVRVIRGKAVVNLIPPDAPHKGVALERLRAVLGCDTALYLGDDETDEDVFALDQPGRLLGIRVGRNARSAAGYYLKSQSEVAALLQVLLRFRSSSPNRRRLEG